MLPTTEQSPAARVQSALLAYRGEQLSMSHPLILAIRAWLPQPKILDIITVAQREYRGNAAADALAKIAADCSLWWNQWKFVAVMLFLCLSIAGLAGCNGGELVHASGKASPSSQFVITEHEPCPETAPETSVGNALQPIPTDGSGQGLVESSVDQGAVESIKLIQEQANEILDLKSELDELRVQNNELTQAMGKLLAELGDLKAKDREPQVAATHIPAKRSICILSSPTCAPCIAWKRAAEQSPETQTVEKRFIDVTQGKPADIDASEWNMVIAKWNSAGGLVPFSWWKDKSGVIRTLVGRYSDSQIEWSMNAADEQVVIPQQQNQQHQQHRPQRNYSSPIAQIFESR